MADTTPASYHFSPYADFDAGVVMPKKPNPAFISVQDLEQRILAHEKVLVVFRAPHDQQVRNGGLYFKAGHQGRLRYRRLPKVDSFEWLNHRIRRYTDLPYKVILDCPGTGSLPIITRNGVISNVEQYHVVR